MADASNLMPSNGNVTILGGGILGDRIRGVESIAEGCSTILGDTIRSGGVNLQTLLADAERRNGSVGVLASGTDEAVLHNASSAT